jgi:hypothetical protein
MFEYVYHPFPPWKILKFLVFTSYLHPKQTKKTKAKCLHLKMIHLTRCLQNLETCVHHQNVGGLGWMNTYIGIMEKTSVW